MLGCSNDKVEDSAFVAEPAGEPSGEPAGEPAGEPSGEPVEPPVFTVDLSCFDADGDGTTDTVGTVSLTGPQMGNWDPAEALVASDNGDGTWSVALSEMPMENVEYKWIADGAQEELMDDVQAGLSCAPLNDGNSFANRQWLLGEAEPTDTFGNCYTCAEQQAIADFILVNAGFESGVQSWLTFPASNSNFNAVSTGEGIFDPAIGEASSTVFFEAAEGSMALKIWGSNDANASATPVYQQFSAPTEGEVFTLTGQGYVSSLDPFTEGDSYAQLIIKVYDTNFTELDSGTSEHLDSTTVADEWVELSASVTIPADTAYLQAIVEFVQSNGGGGAVYVDDLHLSRQ